MKFIIYTLMLFVMSYLVSSHPAMAAQKSFDYQLKPEKIADNTYLIRGKLEDFSKKNGGNILNTAFIVTQAGIIVIDSGPSRRYGEQQRAAISSVSDKKIIRVFNTHHHPDHFLGNQAYPRDTLYATKRTQQALQQHAAAFTDNMYRMVGDWMRETEATIPRNTVVSSTQKFGKHTLQFLLLDGHTEADLVIFDQTTGVLFSGDLVFNQRALSTSQANIEKWQASLKQLSQVNYKQLVPGHGPISHDQKAIKQTSNYLNWLITTLTASAEQGDDMMEVMHIQIPQRFSSIALTRYEWQRSVVHLYPKIEKSLLLPQTQ